MLAADSSRNQRESAFFAEQFVLLLEPDMLPGPKHSRARNTLPGSERKQTRAEIDTVQVSGTRYGRVSMPRFPLPAIFSFAIIGFGGALFLSYSSFDTGDAIQFARQNSDVPVCSARAVPRDSQSAGFADQRSGQGGRLTASDGAGTEKVYSTRSSALFSSSARGQLRRVHAFSEFRTRNWNVGPAVATSAVRRMRRQIRLAVAPRKLRRTACRPFRSHLHGCPVQRWSHSLLRAVFHPRWLRNQRLVERKLARCHSPSRACNRISG
jgi:hypothetical protein